MKRNLFSRILVGAIVFTITANSLIAEVLPEKNGEDIFTGCTFYCEEESTKYVFNQNYTVTRIVDSDAYKNKIVYNYSVDAKKNILYLQIKSMDYTENGMREENLGAQEYAKISSTSMDVIDTFRKQYDLWLYTLGLDESTSESVALQHYIEYMKVSYGLPKTTTLETYQQELLKVNIAYYKLLYSKVRKLTYSLSADGKTITLTEYYDPNITLSKLYNETYMPYSIGALIGNNKITQWGSMSLSYINDWDDEECTRFFIKSIDDNYITAVVNDYTKEIFDTKTFDFISVHNDEFGKEIIFPYAFVVGPTDYSNGKNGFTVIMNYKGSPVTISYPDEYSNFTLHFKKQ